MKETNTNTVEELLEVGSFSNLNEIEKELVLQEMTAQEFDQLRTVLGLEKTFISIDKFNIEANSEIQKHLNQKLKSKPRKTALIKQLYIYGSSIAAILILLFAMFTYFFQDSSVREKNPIAETKQETNQIDSTKSAKPKNIKPLKNEPEVLAKLEMTKEAKKSISKTTLLKTKEEEEEVQKQSDFAVNPEEFNALTSEIIIDEIEEDATLAYFSDESERAFHYYTRID